jgi:hypothetical protein
MARDLVPLSSIVGEQIYAIIESDLYQQIKQLEDEFEKL